MKLLFLFFLIFIFSSSLYAASINGFVTDEKSGETIVGATIYLKGTKFGAYTNKAGYYSINGIPAGNYEINVSSIGYKKYSENIKLTANQSLRKKIILEPNDIYTDEVRVEADREADKNEIIISRVDIPMREIKKIRIGGEADIFRSIQFLPGILTSSQISSGLFVRGGSPDQNLVLLDGSTVYNPTHLFGFISTFNPEAIKDVELIKGGFPAEYGGRLSAVLNITQKDGNKNNYDGMASIGVISSRASVEGPLGNGSFFLGGRRTYFELVKAFIPDDPESPLPDFNFYDVNAKVSQQFGRNDKFFASGFVSADNLSYGSYGIDVGLGIGNRSGALKWTHIFGDNLFSDLNVSASHYNNSLDGGQSGFNFAFENTITDYTIKNTVEWFTSDRITHKFGFETVFYNYGYFSNFSGDEDSTASSSSNESGMINLNVKDVSHSGFVQVNWKPMDIISLQAGLRGNYWKLRNEFNLNPRLAIRYQLNGQVALKAAWGMFSQNLRLASQPDFSFFDTWLPTDSTLPISKAQHFVFSVETKPYDEFSLNFDTYYKKLNNISEINRYLLDAETSSDVFFIGDANAYGAEVFLQKKTGKLTGWFGYALGFIYAKFDSINGGKEFRPKYDRRHDLKLVVNYHYNDSWDFGMSFTFQSGQSYTGATSRFQIRMPEMTTGRGVLIPSERYGLRLPPSHQLNMNAAYSFKMYGFPAKVILDVFNVYNRRDIWFRYYDTKTDETKVEDVRLLPILPTLSFEIKFSEAK